MLDYFVRNLDIIDSKMKGIKGFITYNRGLRERLTCTRSSQLGCCILMVFNVGFHFSGVLWFFSRCIMFLTVTVT